MAGKQSDAVTKFSIRRPLLVVLAIFAILMVLPVGLLVAEGLIDERSPSDVAIVLGNQVHPDGSPSPRLAARLDAAVGLYRDGVVGQVLVSGGTGREGVPEGDAMRTYLMHHGIPDSAIIVDNAGVDTWATAKNARTIMNAKSMTSAIVVSQYFHISRTRLAFRKQGLKVGGVHARFFEARDLYSTARELPAYVSYLFR